MTETANVERVFGDPIERDGCLSIPVAKVRGGVGGGGDGADEEGGGGGLGFAARPVGVFSVRDGALDPHSPPRVGRGLAAGGPTSTPDGQRSGADRPVDALAEQVGVPGVLDLARYRRQFQRPRRAPDRCTTFLNHLVDNTVSRPYIGIQPNG